MISKVPITHRWCFTPETDNEPKIVFYMDWDLVLLASLGTAVNIGYIRLRCVALAVMT